MFFWSFLFIICMAVHHVSGSYRSCKELRDDLGVDEDGIFHLRTRNGMEYQTFCDMATVGGGWTLVASVHENNVFGKCTVDDRWSSQQGNKLLVPGGDGSWQNRNTFGTVEGATSEDFKYCIGGGGYIPDAPRMCADFSAFDWSGYGTKSGWSASKKLIESSVLIFYR